MQDEIMVSVIVLTYNHEKYIRQALESILMQQVDFKYEVLVGDDCSTDSTPQILLEYQNKYPELFCVRLRHKNIGATKNLYELQMLARGKYLAYLEGDDYWLNNKKLQKQVNFLLKHSNYIGSSHDCKVVNGNGEELTSKRYHNKDNFWIFFNDQYTFDDFKNWRLPGQIATLVHKNIFLNSSEDFSIIYTAHKMVADRTLVLILLRYGDFAHIKERWSSYRIVDNKNGQNWSSIYKHQINNVEDDLILISNLNEYSKKILGKEIYSENLRKRNILHALLEMVKKPSWKSACLFIQLLFQEQHKLECLSFCCKTIVRKMVIRAQDYLIRWRKR